MNQVQVMSSCHWLLSNIKDELLHSTKPLISLCVYVQVDLNAGLDHCSMFAHGPLSLFLVWISQCENMSESYAGSESRDKTAQNVQSGLGHHCPLAVSLYTMDYMNGES